ncbi:MAG: hypothetical protein V3V33_09350 [Candidatus Lokiarchaeia archaeon]
MEKLIEQLNPDKFNQVRRNYHYYIKAMIYFRSNELMEANKVLDNFFKQINKEEIYTIYYDINH